jgi:hypothetical protein
MELTRISDIQEAASLQPGRRPRLDVVNNQPAANDSPRPAQPDTNWLSEQDFMRTLELVDKACHDLRASEERVRMLEVQREELLQHAEEKFEAAQDLIRSAEERAARAEGWAKHLEERTIRAEARAIEAEERSNADREWLIRIQRAIERFGDSPTPQRSAEDYDPSAA